MENYNLENISTKAPEQYDKETTKAGISQLIEKLSDLQHLLYAEGKHSLLIVLQGLDAAGKDGLIRKVFTGVNPMGCDVKSFKQPTDLELDHDFLWRVHTQTPRKGMIKIFNRSHYEDVLVPRVHGWIDQETWHKRYDHINNFEKLLADNGTHVLKFYLHISQEEQAERLSERLSDPRKKWKYDPADKREGKHWDQYIPAYLDIFTYCSEIPWMIIPSDQNWYKEYLVAKAIVEKLESLKMKYPDFSE